MYISCSTQSPSAFTSVASFGFLHSFPLSLPEIFDSIHRLRPLPLSVASLHCLLFPPFLVRPLYLRRSATTTRHLKKAEVPLDRGILRLLVSESEIALDKRLRSRLRKFYLTEVSQRS